jgi:fermentation-respiration switch protein FrsA (DUF1100 family)
MHFLPSWATWTIAITGVLVVLYLLFCPRLNILLYRPLLFHPWRSAENEPVAPPLAGVTGENVYFPSENGKMLNGWLYANPKAVYTIIFNHGNGGNIAVRTDLVQLLLMAGASVFIYDYEGYGESVGKPTVEGICEDGAGAYKFLTGTKNVPADKIILYGESLGAAVAANISSRFQCKAIVLQSGFSSLYRIACEVFPLLRIYPAFLFPNPALDNLSVLMKPHPPVLLIHGDEDTVIPVRHAKQLYEKAVGPKKFLELPKTGHANIYTTASSVYVRAMKSFLSSLN